jgi:hypothetical protein
VRELAKLADRSGRLSYLPRDRARSVTAHLTWTMTAGLRSSLQETACNCKTVSVFAFFELGTSWWGGDAASRRGGEIKCNITSKTQGCAQRWSLLGSLQLQKFEKIRLLKIPGKKEWRGVPSVDPCGFSARGLKQAAIYKPRARRGKVLVFVLRGFEDQLRDSPRT